MTEWFDVLVYAAFMVALWIVMPTVSARFTRAMIEDRNPEWAAAHPEVIDRLTRSRWYLRGSYSLGVLGIAALVAAQTDAWPAALSAPAFEPEHWRVLSVVNTGSVILWLVYAAGGGALFGRWLATHVPLAERRRASLQPRSIDVFVPRRMRIAVGAVVAVHLATWLFVGAFRLHAAPAPSFWGMVAFQFAMAAILLCIVRTIVLRPPNTMDRVFGPGFRRTEVRYAFLAQLVPLLNTAARLPEAIVGTPSSAMDRTAQLGLVLFMMGMVLVGFGRFSWPSRPEDRRSTTGDGALQAGRRS
jgi:hypothetical protein